jgi:hypothetical protein
MLCVIQPQPTLDRVAFSAPVENILHLENVKNSKILRIFLKWAKWKMYKNSNEDIFEVQWPGEDPLYCSNLPFNVDYLA